MAIAQLSKVKLEYFPHGEGPERVVFIHGFQASARIWRMVQEALPADRYSSIAINNRGAGGSEAPPDEADFSVQHFAADAFELVTQLGWRDFTLVGHSMGGATAAQFAVDHPGAAQGPGAARSGRSGRPRAAAGGRRAGRAASMRGWPRGASSRRGARRATAIDAAGTGAPRELMRALAEDMRNAPERRLRGSMRSMIDLRLGERVKTLPMPVLLAGGDADELIPVGATCWPPGPSTRPGTGLHFWHGVGHSPNLDCPAELAALIRRFVEKTIPARAKSPVAA